MIGALSHAEIESQYAELLPARTVLSLIDLSLGGDGGKSSADGGDQEAHNVKGDVFQHADGGKSDASGGDGIVLFK